MATPYYTTEEACLYTENWREHETDASAGGAVATPHGTISLRLRNRIRVDMTVDRAVRVINFKVCPSFYLLILDLHFASLRWHSTNNNSHSIIILRVYILIILILTRYNNVIAVITKKRTLTKQLHICVIYIFRQCRIISCFP